jgi:hypothetical protein
VHQGGSCPKAAHAIGNRAGYSHGRAEAVRVRRSTAQRPAPRTAHDVEGRTHHRVRTAAALRAHRLPIDLPSREEQRRCNGISTPCRGPSGGRVRRKWSSSTCGASCAAKPSSPGRCRPRGPRPEQDEPQAQHEPARRRAGGPGRARPVRGPRAARAAFGRSCPVHRRFTAAVHRPFIERCSTCRVSEVQGIRQRAAVRDALAARTRGLTGAALAVSAVLSGLFAGIAAASAPGHKLLHGGSTPASKSGTAARTVRSSTAIPPLPAAPGPGSLSAPSPPAPTPAPAPSPTQSPPVVVSGGS